MADSEVEEKIWIRWWWLGAALALVLLIRLYGLRTAALPDYDSVRNWQILREIAGGNLRQLFHHGAPGFSVLYAPLAWATTDFRVYQHLNAVVGVLALAVLAGFVGREAGLRGGLAALLLLLMGSSVFLTFSGRDFTMSAWSLLLFSGLLRAYFRRLHAPGRANLLGAAMWLMLGLTINYKFLLCLPIMAVLELAYGQGLLWRNGNWWRVLLVVLLPYVVFGAIGVAAGLPWYRWLAVYYKIPFPGADNLAGRSGQPKLYADWLYYLRFLLDFESPLALLTLLGAPFVFGRSWWQRRGSPPHIAAYLAVWVYCFLAGMSLVQKAPRGLLLAYAPLYALGFLSLYRLLPVRVLTAVVLVAVLHNLHLVRQQVYAYTGSNYPQVVNWLRQHQAQAIGSTVGIGISPYMPQPDAVAWVINERQLPALRRQGYQYVLLDSYWRVAGVEQFDSLRQQAPLAAWREPALTSPLLFLEHSEYTGRSYTETLNRQRAAAADPYQLRLYRLPAPK